MRGLKKALIIMPIIIGILFASQVSYVYYFNSQQHVLTGQGEDGNVGLTVSGKEGATSQWLKRGFDLYGETVNLMAQTMSVEFANNTAYEIDRWQIMVSVEDDCLLNQAWCGTTEIHQHVDGKERVQTLDLRNFSLDDITLEYLYDGDLLIPLSKGDYVIYYPSTEDNEQPVSGNTRLICGFILYYLEFPVNSTFELTYSFNRHITDGYNIYPIVALSLVWLIALMFYFVSNVTYKNTVKEMEIKKSGILSLSDIYSIIYIIDLRTGELMPVVADEDSEKLRPKNGTAAEQLKGMFEHDSSDNYKELALEFCDLDTLNKRLEDRNTIVFEYVSANYGWCRTRFFVMDRNKDGTVERVLFTIQIINDEKAEVEAVVRRADEMEHENQVRSTFLANMSHEIRTPINTIIGLNTMILKETSEPVVRSYARSAKSASDMLLSIFNEILDMSRLETDSMELVPEEYSFRQLMFDIVGMMRTRTEFDRLEFKYEIAESIPDRLYGDQARLKQVIINLILNAVKYTEKGSVTLSVFGKSHDGQAHLLISVKDTGTGIQEEDLKHLTDRLSGQDEKRLFIEGGGLGLELITGILRLMGSRLHVVSQYGEGSEFYFELEQRILEETPVGRIDFDAEPVEECKGQEQLPDIQGVDAAYGLTHTGGMKQYLTVLRQFTELADNDLDELMACVSALKQNRSDREQLKNFRNKLYSMKNLTGTIGAFQTYGMAELLEEAALHGRTEDILTLMPYFAENWRRLRNSVEERLPIQKKNRRPEGEALDSLLHLLETCMKSNDIKNADFVMEKLQSFTWDEEENAILKELRIAVTRLDMDRVISLSAELKKQ